MLERTNYETDYSDRTHKKDILNRVKLEIHHIQTCEDMLMKYDFSLVFVRFCGLK